MICDVTFGAGILQMKDGYFWDPVQQEYFIPRGFAYQTFNPPVGASQTLEQLEYDLREFKKMHANSVRAEFVWNTVEVAPGVFDWSKPDFLVTKAQELGLRLFVLIGFQYAPDWFPDSWKATNDNNEVSVVLNYEHPQARVTYSNFIYQVTSRYRNTSAIGAWILGNEYAYFDLWNPDHRYLGFDPYSLDSYHRFLSEKYRGHIASLNATWGAGANYTNFNDIPMFRQYPSDRNNPGYHDLLLWREHSIGQYTAVGAVAAKLADPEHLRTYSMVGGLFIGNDANFTCEDAKSIVAACGDAGAPLHFWSINNYAWATYSAELRSADAGVAKHMANSGLPVLVTETGHSTTDDLLPGAAERQADALAGQMWESLMSGAIGTHIFTWNDRDLFNGVFIRERGFGVVDQTRLPKPVYTNVAQMFLRMENLPPERLFPNSRKPKPDIALFWSKAAEMGWPRANQENAQIWAALKRLGYQMAIVDDAAFATDAFTNASALLLSRCYQMNPADLERIMTNVVPRGIHVHANADLPGQYDTYHHPNPAWLTRMADLFGLDVSLAIPGWDSGVTYTDYAPLSLFGVNNLGRLTNGYSANIQTWKIWHRLRSQSGTTIATQTGLNGTEAPMPALQIKDLGTAKAAVNTFALADLRYAPPMPTMYNWDVRYDWLQAIYSNYFGLKPAITLSGPGANYATADYRFCSNGSVLISVLNEVTNQTTVTLTAQGLLAGKTVEDLTAGRILTQSSSGSITLSMPGDAYVLLYIYFGSAAPDNSLLNTNQNKLRILDAPGSVWSAAGTYSVKLGYDVVPEPGVNAAVAFERVLGPNRVYSQTNVGTINGSGTLDVPISIPDPNLNDPWYISSLDGGEYVFHAWLEKGGVHLADSYAPVRLAWAVRPVLLPQAVAPGANYNVTVEWQELPSWLESEQGLPLDRARLWQPYLANQQYYKVILQLRSADVVVVSQEFLTNVGNDSHTFSIRVPANATGPFTWSAFVRTAPNASIDMVDSFEDRDTGTNSPPPALPLYYPWYLQMYAENTSEQGHMYFDSGVGTNSSDGKQSVFFIITNPPTVGSFSGSFLVYSNAQHWSLPRDPAEWTNYSFGFDYREEAGLSCILEMQVKDSRDGQIHFTNAYAPGPGGWFSMRATLDQFSVPPWVGHFDPDDVSQLIVNIQWQQRSVVYRSWVDNIRFTGPKTANQTVAPTDIWESFDNRPPAQGSPAGWDALVPWSTYVWPQPDREWDRGVVSSQGLNGGQAAFMVVTNPYVGDVSVFGLYRNFTNVWALPTDRSKWTDYVFSYNFREQAGQACSLEMQVKSGANNWIEFKKPYSPGPGGWDRVAASLAEFQQAPGIDPFDPANVQAIAVNIRMLETNATYVGFFDNVFFDAPDTLMPSGTLFGSYVSTNDAALPNPPFAIQGIQMSQDGHVTLSWGASSNLVYAVEYQDGDMAMADEFVALPGLTNLWSPVDRVISATDLGPVSTARFYRVRSQPR